MRRPSRLLLIPAVLAAGLALPAVPASSAAAVTCDGLPATIVGPGNGRLVGTAGDDVIVTAGATSINAGDGDDHLCVTGASLAVTLNAGPGDDVVDVVPVGLHDVYAVLGTGDDVFRGGRERDHVGDLQEFGTGSPGLPASGRDVISTGEGDDEVQVGSSDAGNGVDPGEPVADAVALGEGDDLLRVESRIAPGFSAVGGAGRDIFDGWAEGRAQRDEGLTWTFDALRGRVVEGASSYPWRSFETADLRMDRAAYRGGPADEQAYFDFPPTIAVMGAGDDTVELGSPAAGATLLSGGPGHDLFRDYELGGRMTADLGAGRIIDDGGFAAPVPLVGFEALDLISGRRLTMIGTGQADDLRGAACRVRAYGHRGADVITAGNPGEDDECTVRARFFGGRGDDRLSGSPGEGEGGEFGYAGNDRLIGGRGHDRANGRGGRDLCRAEVRRHCERR